MTAERLTPQTDAIRKRGPQTVTFARYAADVFDLCEKLERQRDELRELLILVTVELETVCTHQDLMTDWTAEVITKAYAVLKGAA